MGHNTYNHYFYLTDNEQTRFGEFIWFWYMDSIFGRVHANSDIGVHAGAFFGKEVTTTGSIFSPVGSTFLRSFVQHVQPVDFPTQCDEIRAAAGFGGTWLSSSNHRYIHGLLLEGTTARIWRWETGTPSTFGTLNGVIGTIGWNPRTDYAIFCDGDLWVTGVLTGRLGIGAAGNILLPDNLVYSDAQIYPYRYTDISPNMLTLVSEAVEVPEVINAPYSGILIANTVQNGRDNGIAQPITMQSQRDIAIHGQLIALNASFTFIDQNDGWSSYSGPSPDERGYIYLRGAIAQKRRGYVHRSTHGGTGYGKSYYYDTRFVVTPPPFTIEVTSRGFVRWKFEAWSDAPGDFPISND